MTEAAMRLLASKGITQPNNQQMNAAMQALGRDPTVGDMAVSGMPQNEDTSFVNSLLDSMLKNAGPDPATQPRSGIAPNMEPQMTVPALAAPPNPAPARAVTRPVAALSGGGGIAPNTEPPPGSMPAPSSVGISPWWLAPPGMLVGGALLRQMMRKGGDANKPPMSPSPAGNVNQVPGEVPPEQKPVKPPVTGELPIPDSKDPRLAARLESANTRGLNREQLDVLSQLRRDAAGGVPLDPLSVSRLPYALRKQLLGREQVGPVTTDGMIYGDGVKSGPIDGPEARTGKKPPPKPPRRVM